MPKEPAVQRQRRWAFTVNAVNGILPKLNLELSKDLLYYCYQLEKGEQGTLHYQGCLRLSSAMRLNSVKQLIGCETMHLEPAISWDQLISYCKKESTRVEGPWEAGDPSPKKTQTEKKDSISQALIQGTTNLLEVARQTPGQIVTHGTGFMRLLTFRENPVYKQLRVFLLLGPTGKGKSLSIRKIFPEAYVLADNKNPWADGYYGQRELVIEEFGPGMMNINTMKRMLDSYAILLPVKGGFVHGTFDTVIITSNNSIDAWYPQVGEADLAALTRRIRVCYFDNDDNIKFAINSLLSWKKERDTALSLPPQAQKIVDLVDRLAADQTWDNQQPQEGPTNAPDVPDHSLSVHDPPRVVGDIYDLDLDLEEGGFCDLID